MWSLRFYSIVRRSVCVFLFGFVCTRHIATQDYKVVHALATLVFQRLLVVVQKLLPFICFFSYAVDDALTVGAHEVIPSPLVFRGKAGLRLKPYTSLPPLLNG